MKTSLIVAMTEGRLIGKDGGLPWRVPADLKYFKAVTTGHAVVMGRKTFDEIKKPLPNRRNYVVSRHVPGEGDARLELGVEWCGNLKEAVEKVRGTGETECFIIGGSQIYRAALEQQLADRMYVTYVHLTPEPTGDTYFPEWEQQAWRETQRRREAVEGGWVEFVVYERKGLIGGD